MVPLGMRAASVVLMATSAGAQKICADDSKFLPDATFQAGTSDLGLCSWWAENVAASWGSQDICMDPVDVVIPGVAGSAVLAVNELQRALAWWGCCEDMKYGCEPPSPTGCDGTHDHGGTPYPLKESDGLCYPCYGVWDAENKDCHQCWALGAHGCTEQQCSDLNLGNWDSEEQRCRECNSMSFERCPESECAQFGGRYRCWGDNDNQECRCASCTPGGDISGCSEEECNQHGLNYICFGNDCQCRACCLGGFTDGCYGHWTGCNQDQCRSTNEVPDANWVIEDHWEQQNGNWEKVGQFGRCARCIDDGEDEDTGGCVNRGLCEQVPGRAWGCAGDEDGRHCCQECGGSNLHGCQDESQCASAGGTWKCEWGHCNCGKCCFEDHCGGSHRYCSQTQCTAPDATWMNYTYWEHDQEQVGWKCARCIHSEHHHDREGCDTEAKCEAIEGNVWNCDENDKDTRHCCQRCTADERWGCSTEQQCSATSGDWVVSHGHGRCGKCCIDGHTSECNGDWNYCPQDRCTAADAKWVTHTWYEHIEENDSHVEREGGSCRRCFNNDAGHGSRSTEGCQSKEECESVPGTSWNCKPGEQGGHCCRWCLEDDLGGCKDKAACQAVGGGWCAGADHPYCTMKEHMSDECKVCVNLPIDDIRANNIEPVLCNSRK